MSDQLEAIERQHHDLIINLLIDLGADLQRRANQGVVEVARQGGWLRNYR